MLFLIFFFLKKSKKSPVSHPINLQLFSFYYEYKKLFFSSFSSNFQQILKVKCVAKLVLLCFLPFLIFYHRNPKKNSVSFTQLKKLIKNPIFPDVFLQHTIKKAAILEIIFFPPSKLSFSRCFFTLTHHFCILIPNFFSFFHFLCVSFSQNVRVLMMIIKKFISRVCLKFFRNHDLNRGRNKEKG